MVNPLRLRRSSIELLAQCESIGALWRHDGNALRPHAELTSGMHSIVFFNGDRLKERPVLLDEVTYDLAERLAAHIDLNAVSWCIGPAMGAITVAHDLARNITAITGNTCRTGYAQWKERPHSAADGAPVDKWMELPRTDISSGDGVLLVEDTCTTGGTIEKAASAVEKAGGRVLPVNACVVNRSGKKVLHGRPVVSLIELPATSWVPGDCPLCKQGSVALRPKADGNWARLNANY